MTESRLSETFRVRGVSRLSRSLISDRGLERGESETYSIPFVRNASVVNCCCSGVNLAFEIVRFFLGLGVLVRLDFFPSILIAEDSKILGGENSDTDFFVREILNLLFCEVFDLL